MRHSSRLIAEIAPDNNEEGSEKCSTHYSEAILK
jgi:hypothetical protein